MKSQSTLNENLIFSLILYMSAIALNDYQCTEVNKEVNKAFCISDDFYVLVIHMHSFTLSLDLTTFAEIFIMRRERVKEREEMKNEHYRLHQCNSQVLQKIYFPTFRLLWNVYKVTQSKMKALFLFLLLSSLFPQYFYSHG